MGKVFFKKLIVAINGRESSICAAMYSIMMARTYNTELKFIYVIDTATIKYLSLNRFLVSSEAEDFSEKLKKDGEHYLNYVKMLAISKGIKAETEIRRGGVFTEVVKSADEFESDLIILGSENKDIYENAHCPVLVVKDKDIEAKFKIF